MIQTLLTSLPLLYFMVKRLSKAENRGEVLKKFHEAMKDGRMSVTEWTSIGSAMGVFKKDE